MDLPNISKVPLKGLPKDDAFDDDDDAEESPPFTVDDDAEEL
jgi:hypothetical protein